MNSFIILYIIIVILILLIILFFNRKKLDEKLNKLFEKNKTKKKEKNKKVKKEKDFDYELLQDIFLKIIKFCLIVVIPSIIIYNIYYSIMEQPVFIGVESNITINQLVPFYDQFGSLTTFLFIFVTAFMLYIYSSRKLNWMY